MSGFTIAELCIAAFYAGAALAGHEPIYLGVTALALLLAFLIHAADKAEAR